jgi:hypothetical protein
MSFCIGTKSYNRSNASGGRSQPLNLHACPP